MLLGRPEVAEPAFHEALTLVHPSRVRSQACISLHLADAYLGQGELEEAGKVIGEALEISAGHWAATMTQLADNLHTRLRQWPGHPVARDLDEALMVLTAPPKP